MRPRPSAVAGACVVALLVATVGFVVAPRSLTLSTAESGDPDLRDRARDVLAGQARDRASVVEIDGHQTRTAHFGADGHTDYEIGSVTKALTGLLLADAVERGEVTEDTQLGELIDLGDAPASDVTLAELSSHRSGLPRLPSRVTDQVGMGLAVLSNRNPYTADLDTLVDQVAAADLDGRGEVSYSNMGTAILGHALAEAAGTDYRSLLRERLLEPVGMSATTLPETNGDVSEGATLGYGRNGRISEPWPSIAYAPMGGVRSTPADLARLAKALLDGSAPGAEAMERRWDDTDGGKVGLGWFVDDHDGTDVTWHNGAGGGFTSMLALDRRSGRAVVVLNNTEVSVDDEAVRLLLEHS